MSRLWIDHVIYAVDDLDAAGAALFDREGLASVPGGRPRAGEPRTESCRWARAISS